MVKKIWVGALVLFLAAFLVNAAAADPLGRSVQTILKNIDKAATKYIAKFGEGDFQEGFDRAVMKANADKLKEKEFLKGIVHPVENVYYVLKTPQGMWVGLDLAGLKGNYNTPSVREYLQSEADGKLKLLTLDGETFKPYVLDSSEVFTHYTDE